MAVGAVEAGLAGYGEGADDFVAGGEGLDGGPDGDDGAGEFVAHYVSC